MHVFMLSTNGGSGAGVYVLNENIRIKQALDIYAIVFQTEVYAKLLEAES